MITELIARFESAEAAESACHTLPQRCPVLVACRVSEGRFLHVQVQGGSLDPVEAILRASGARDVTVLDAPTPHASAPASCDRASS